MKIEQYLKDSMPLFTEKQKRIAEYMLGNLSKMSYITLKELSQIIGCTEVTILNFCKKLGFATFADMKNAFRASIMQDENSLVSDMGGIKYPMNTEDKASLETHLKDVLSYETNSIIALSESIDLGSIKKIAQHLVYARIVYLGGRGTSLDVADFFRRRLSSLGLNAQLIDPEDLSSVQSSLNRMSKDDVFVFVTYPMYYSPLINIAGIAHSYGAYIVAITDKKSAPISEFCNDQIATGSIGGGYYYSFSHAMICTGLISTAVQYLIQDRGQQHTADSLAERIGPPDFIKP